ncbi:MAG: hypothetical protein ACLTZT_09530 [Butyricimonas faecalis]
MGDEYDKDEEAWKEENPDADDEDEDEVNSRPYVIKYRNAVAELCRNGGYITGEVLVPSRGFFEWLRLLVMESYENIKKDYLDNSKSRALKYEIIIKYFKEYGWDIQVAGINIGRNSTNIKHHCPRRINTLIPIGLPPWPLLTQEGNRL